MRRRKVPVSMHALTQRINRKLRPKLEILQIARDEPLRLEVGYYYIIDFRTNAVTHTNVDPKQLARELEVLKPWEIVQD